MSYTDDVNFEADQASESTGGGIAAAESKMVNWLIGKGWAKDARQAQYILLGVAAGALVVGFLAFKVLGVSGTVSYLQTPPQERIIPGPGGQPAGTANP